ncbi:hypothetical protein [Litoreibacter arenae]|uniref:hypothetical protein n=1 Tax=Litoreibacter arenae TaxID=491388 RepID=UPI0005929197|nr:hypothetical protein [Litoreibacter arenae]
MTDIAFGEAGFVDLDEIHFDVETQVSRPIVLGRKNTSGNLELVVRRDGPSGPFYTLREVRESPLASRYLAEGEDVGELSSNLGERGAGNYVELDENDQNTPMYQIALQSIAKAKDLGVLK